ncbi:MAG: trypsin-like peptidase domain-containing protein [Nocardioides sp.]|nr:trypsin-like peptidase domain-containing protein [Nocardioides sp.]
MSDSDRTPDPSEPSDPRPVWGHDEPTVPFALGARSQQPPSWTPPAVSGWPAPGEPGSGPGTHHLPVAPVAGGSHRSGRISGWVWPAVAAMALVIGLLGGVAGSVVYDNVGGDDPIAGTVDGGLASVDTVSAPPLDPDDTNVAAVAAKLLPSTVQISAEFQGDANGATGSGFVLDKQGHVITNNHVVASAAEDDGQIQVVDQDGNRYDATVVGRSPVYDLAVLYAPDATDLTPAALGASQVLRVGDPVVAIGSPLGLSSTVTAGIVSSLNRPVTTGDSSNESSYINAVQTDAAINPGNSGGPLVNLLGQVVGVNSAIATNGGASSDAGNIGVGFAIPVEQVRITADQILKTGEARYPVIGASIQTGDRDGLGAPVQEVMAGTPAEDAGIEEGDLITAVDGERVTDGVSLIVSIRTHQPGETLEFTVERGGAEQQISIVLGSEVG